jgi:hypothetical protein
MFEHVTILLSFVFAIALTHLLQTTSELVLARDRVRFSGLHALWIGNALISLTVNWLSFWDLNIIKHWTVSEVVLQFAAAIIQYFTCSTLSLRVPEDGPIDVPAFFEKQKPVIFGAFSALMLMGMLQNWWDRDHTLGLSPTDWIGENAGVFFILVSVLVAWFAKPKWLQWAGGLATVAGQTYFLVTYAMPF